jgi:adenylate cyclase
LSLTEGLTPGTREEVTAGLRALLLARGVTAEEVDAAEREDRLDLLAVDRLMLPGREHHTGDDLYGAVALDPGVPTRLWRALGFADEAGAQDAFTEQDLEALQLVYGLVSLGLASLETTVQLTRVMGSSMERFAEALAGAFEPPGHGGAGRGFLPPGVDDRLAIAEQVAFASEVVLPSVERLILYAWRRHMQAAMRRRVTLIRDVAGQDAHLPALTVAFADMVGFTALSQQLSDDDLARVVDRFEAVAHDTVVAGGGRVVKMIGDEVMYVTEFPRQGLEIAFLLVDAYADDELLSDVRVGMATGRVLARDGDYFGSVVNRASRIVNIADAGTVLVSTEVRDAVAEYQDVVFVPLRARELKDFGRVELFAASRLDAPSVSDSRRTGARWRRLSDLRHELELLRARGEAVLDSIAPHAET